MKFLTKSLLLSAIATTSLLAGDGKMTTTQKVADLQKQVTELRQELAANSKADQKTDNVLKNVKFELNPVLHTAYDANGANGDNLDFAEIPVKTVDANAQKSGTVRMHARATTFGFKAKVDAVEAYLQADLDGAATGSSYTPRMKHGYVRHTSMNGHQWTAGQTTTVFADVATSGEILENQGLDSTALRQAGLSYKHAFTKNTSLAVGAERPYTDITLSDGTMVKPNLRTGFSTTSAYTGANAPDVTAQIKHETSMGHVTLSGLARELRVRAVGRQAALVGNSGRKIGWGTGLTGLVYVNGKSTSLYGQAFGGKGVGRYFSDLTGQAAYVTKNAAGKTTIDTQKAYQFVVGMQHMWNEKYRSNVFFRYTCLKEAKGTPVGAGIPQINKKINVAGTNFIYTPVKGMDVGLEYLWARRETVAKKKGTANRVTAMVSYKF